MTVKRSYVARRITLLAVAAMAAVAAATVLSATAQNQAPPPRHQLRVERTARQVSAAGASATAIAITPNGRTAYVVTVGDTVTPVNLATRKPGRPIKVGDSASVIAIAPNGRTAYLPNHGVSGDGDTARSPRSGWLSVSPGAGLRLAQTQTLWRSRRTGAPPTSATTWATH